LGFGDCGLPVACGEKRRIGGWDVDFLCGKKQLEGEKGKEEEEEEEEEERW
jgi:hypothetical protein